MNRLKTYVILLVLILIVRLVAFFAASETAFLSVSKIKMRSLVAEKKKNANIYKKLLKFCVFIQEFVTKSAFSLTIHNRKNLIF